MSEGKVVSFKDLFSGFIDVLKRVIDLFKGIWDRSRG